MVVTKAERGTVHDEQNALIQKYQREVEALRRQLVSQNEAIDRAEDREELSREREEEQRQLGQLRDEHTKVNPSDTFAHPTHLLLQYQLEIAEMRQKRTQLGDELQNITRLLLTGSSAHLQSDPSSTTIGSNANFVPSSARKGGLRRVSEIGLGLGTPRRPGDASHGGLRSFSTNLAACSAKVGSLAKVQCLIASRYVTDNFCRRRSSSRSSKRKTIQSEPKTTAYSS